MVKKNSFYNLLYILALLPLMTLYLVLRMKEINSSFILFQAQWLLLLAVGSMGVNENNEEKNGGYYFMRHLPIKAATIVNAKYFLSFLTIAFLVGFNFLLHFMVDGTPYLYKLGKIFIMISGNTALLTCALMYLIIYKFGFSAFQKIAWGTLIPLMLLPIVLLELNHYKKIDLTGIINTLANSRWWIWAVLSGCSMLIFYMLKLLSEKALRASFE